jgi:hypothetical protein
MKKAPFIMAVVGAALCAWALWWSGDLEAVTKIQVNTTDPQTLSSKTLTSPVLTGSITSGSSSYQLGGNVTILSPNISTPAITAPTITTGGVTFGLALTGQTIGDVLYATSSTEYGRLADTLDGHVLRSSGLGSAPLWGKVRLSGATTDIDGILQYANGGTGINAAPQAGQLLIGNGSGFTLGALSNGGGLGINNSAGTISLSALPMGYLFGCTITNNAGDPTNDFDLAEPCEAVSEDSDLLNRRMLIPGAMTKQLDVAWAAGTAQGCRISTEALANGVWHVYLFRRSGGLTDVACSQSLTPSLPDGGTHKRRIFSLVRVSAALKTFVHRGDMVYWKASSFDINATNPGTSAVVATLTVPTGIQVFARVRARLEQATGTSAFIVSSFDQDDELPTVSAAAPLLQGFSDGAAGVGSYAAWEGLVGSNTAGQVRYRLSFSDANTTMNIVTLGYVDSRGRLN